MSLAPAERRVLAMIEASLDRSDPRLARMLTRFTLPTSWGGVVVLTRRLRQQRPRIMPAVAVIVIILAILRSPATPLRCAARNDTAATQVSSCPPPWPAGYAGSTAGVRAAEPAGNQVTPGRATPVRPAGRGQAAASGGQGMAAASPELE